MSMTRPSCTKRATLDEIKDNEWFKGEIYTDEELHELMS